MAPDVALAPANPDTWDVVISYANEDVNLAQHLVEVLEHGGVRGIYYYDKPPRVQHRERIPAEWAEACRGNPGPFFIILYSGHYARSDFCRDEYDHVIRLVCRNVAD